jgi:succinate dehydrogenase / fumarate reductase membrane anchor subunit
MSQDFRTPTRRVRGRGAAGAGTGHFIGERVTSVALAILTPWFVISAALGLDFGRESALAWVANPINATLLILLVLASFYHMYLGMNVIIEDYIEKHFNRIALIILNLFVSFAFATAAILAILSISVGS